jgi:hypothetical protein
VTTSECCSDCLRPTRKQFRQLIENEVNLLPEALQHTNAIFFWQYGAGPEAYERVHLRYLDRLLAPFVLSLDMGDL